MSRHKAFDASRHQAKWASRNKAFGTGVGKLDFPFSEDVTLTLEAFKRSITGLGTESVSMGAPSSVDIAVHDRWYHHCLTMMMSSNMRGQAEIGSLFGKAYNGGIDPQNDDVSDITLDDDFGVGSFAWNGWFDYNNDVELEPSYDILVNSVKFHGRSVVGYLPVGGGIASNIMYYGPNTSLTFTGSNWIRDASLEWIMFYLPGVNAAANNTENPETLQQTIIELRMEITVP